MLLFTLYFVIFLCSFGYFLIIPILLTVVNHPMQSFLPDALAKQWGGVIYAVILGIIPLTSIITAPWLGRLSDFFGRRHFLLIGMSVNLLSFIFILLAVAYANLFILLFAAILNGLASNSQPIAQAAIADISQQKLRTIRFSYSFIAMSLATVIGPLAGDFLAKIAIWNFPDAYTPFIFAILITGISIVLIGWTVSETNIHKTEQSPLSLSSLLKSITDIWRMDKKISFLVLLFFLLEVAWSSYYQQISVFFTQVIHSNENAASLFIGYLGIARVLGLLFLFPIILKLFSLHRIIIGCLLIGGVSMWLMLWHSQLTMWLFIAPAVISFAILYPTILTRISNLTAVTKQGWILSVASTFLGLAWFLSSFIIMGLDHLQQHFPQFFPAILMTLIVMLVLLYNLSKCYKHF